MFPPESWSLVVRETHTKILWLSFTKITFQIGIIHTLWDVESFNFIEISDKIVLSLFIITPLTRVLSWTIVVLQIVVSQVTVKVNVK